MWNFLDANANKLEKMLFQRLADRATGYFVTYFRKEAPTEPDKVN